MLSRHSENVVDDHARAAWNFIYTSPVAGSMLQERQATGWHALCVESRDIIIISFAIRQFQMNPTKPSFDMLYFTPTDYVGQKPARTSLSLSLSLQTAPLHACFWMLPHHLHTQNASSSCAGVGIYIYLAEVLIISPGLSFLAIDACRATHPPALQNSHRRMQLWAIFMVPALLGGSVVEGFHEIAKFIVHVIDCSTQLPQ